jgi:hypothetical protein
MEINRKTILNLLESKAKLKQDVSQETQKVFLKLKNGIEKEILGIKPSIDVNRIRLYSEEKGDNELKVMIGSDALVFQMHTNVFKLQDEHEAWKGSYLKDEPNNGYFGIINIYNFLADSFKYNRLNDSGFLIGRIFINNESHILVEGSGQLGFLFKDPEKNTSEPDVLKHIIQCSFANALDFDLISPPFELIEEVSLGQILKISADIQVKTSKRMGFKQ